MARQWRTITSLEWHHIELAFNWCDSLNDCDWCSPPRQKHCAAKYDELLGYVQTTGGREYEEPSRRADSWENEAPKLALTNVTVRVYEMGTWADHSA